MHYLKLTQNLLDCFVPNNKILKVLSYTALSFLSASLIALFNFSSSVGSQVHIVIIINKKRKKSILIQFVSLYTTSGTIRENE